MKDFKRTETRYILKHVSGKYFKSTPFATSYDAFLTDDILQATRFPTKEIADNVIQSNKGAEFKNVVCPKLRDYLEDNEEATFNDVEKFLKENDYKVLNVYNTDNNGIVNHYLIESMEN